MRAIRRHHIERLKNNRRTHWNRVLSKEELGMVVETPTPCSCFMCGNPRKYFKQKTNQEKRNEDKFKNELKELTNDIYPPINWRN